MDPAGSYSNRSLAMINPALVLPGNKPHLIDEWQEVPGIWDAVRFDVDQNHEYGKYILTGSVLPPQNSYRHSGTGRIASIQMRPMTLYESMDSKGIISLEQIFAGENIEPFVTEINLHRLIDITIRGGWPETLNLPIDKAGKVAREYINTLERNELFRNDQTKRNEAKLSKLLRSLARNNATTVNINTLSADTDGSERKHQNEKEITLSRDTISNSIKDLKDIFIIEEIPAWNPQIRSKTIIRQTSKKIFTDPSLAIAALGVNKQRLLQDLKTFGFMFENLCLRDLMVYASLYDAKVYHYHDNSELEVDAIIEMPDGTWGAFEIKLNQEQIETASGNLLRLKNKMISTKNEPPACLAVITGGGIAKLRNDGVYVLPINALKH